ncbi:transcriptional regulator with XRE-family HTH domain [Flavobacterium sp. W4I14]|nr:transcriptional regulator with XRE-family HTH domain [Flavobacterium sp. W4I14]
MKLSDKIKELRTQHGFSQEELAKQTQLSLRTIQHIEQNETEARGDTLVRLAQVFGLKPVDLTPQTEKEQTYLIPLLNFSALSFFIYPILGFIVPLILWYFKRNGDKKLNETGKKLLNFQATWTLAIFFVNAFSMLIKVMHFGGIFRIYTFLVIIYGFYALNFVLILFNTFRSKNLKDLIYKPAIPFF